MSDILIRNKLSLCLSWEVYMVSHALENMVMNMSIADVFFYIGIVLLRTGYWKRRLADRHIQLHWNCIICVTYEVLHVLLLDLNAVRSHQ